MKTLAKPPINKDSVLLGAKILALFSLLPESDVEVELAEEDVVLEIGVVASTVPFQQYFSKQASHSDGSV